MRIRSVFALASLTLSLTAITPLTAGATLTTSGSLPFCTAAANLYGSPAYFATNWPQLSSANATEAQVLVLVQQLNEFGPTFFNTMALNAPSPSTSAALRKTYVASSTELRDATAVWYANAPATSSTRERQIAAIIAAGHTAKASFTSVAAAVTKACTGFLFTDLADQFAQQQTLRSVEGVFANGGSPNPVTFQTAIHTEVHRILLGNLSMHGNAFTKVQYRVAILGTFVNVCTSIPTQAGRNIGIVKC